MTGSSVGRGVAAFRYMGIAQAGWRVIGESNSDACCLSRSAPTSLEAGGEVSQASPISATRQLRARVASIRGTTRVPRFRHSMLHRGTRISQLSVQIPTKLNKGEAIKCVSRGV